MTRTLNKDAITVKYEKNSLHELYIIEDAVTTDRLIVHEHEAKFIVESLQTLLTKSSNPPEDEL